MFNFAIAVTDIKGGVHIINRGHVASLYEPHDGSAAHQVGVGCIIRLADGTQVETEASLVDVAKRLQWTVVTNQKGE